MNGGKLIVKSKSRGDKYSQFVFYFALGELDVSCIYIKQYADLSIPIFPSEFPIDTIIYIDSLKYIHNTLGPAVIYPKGFKVWYYKGRKITSEQLFELLSDSEKEQAIWHLNEW